VDRLEQAPGQQPREPARIAWIGLDPLARPRGHEPRRHHPAVDPARDQVAIEAEAGGTGLVAAAHARPAAKRPFNRFLVVGQRSFLE
jgi:hypothetical protein